MLANKSDAPLPCDQRCQFSSICPHRVLHLQLSLVQLTYHRSVMFYCIVNSRYYRVKEFYILQIQVTEVTENTANVSCHKYLTLSVIDSYVCCSRLQCRNRILN